MDSKSNELSKAAADLLGNQRSGVLSTHSIKHPGFPYTSIVPYALSATGNPLLLLSSLATHTRNLKENGSSALLIAPNSDDPLSDGRVTLIGTVSPVADAQIEEAKSRYLEAHPKSEQWINFGDFAMYQLQSIDVYIVAGFGNMGWVSPDDLNAKIQ